MPGEITGFNYSKGGIFGDSTLSYTDANSKKRTIARPSTAVLELFQLIDKYATKESPNITPKELVQLRTEFMKLEKPIRGGNSGYIDAYKGLDFAFNTFTSEASDGGKDITPKEIAHIFETIESWYTY